MGGGLFEIGTYSRHILCEVIQIGNLYECLTSGKKEGGGTSKRRHHEKCNTLIAESKIPIYGRSRIYKYDLSLIFQHFNTANV
jgi:hypothetical protein